MPNHCSSSNKSVYNLLWNCCTCNAPWVLRFASQFVMLLAVPPHSSRQLLCPSRHFVHSFLRSASLHLVRSYSFASRPGIPLPNTKQHTRECTGLLQAKATILTGFHSAALRHSFTSVAFSPPAAHNLACLAACHGCGFVMVFVTPTTGLNKTKTHAKPLRLTVAVYRRITAF